MKKVLSLLALTTGLILASINTAHAVFIDFDTDQAGIPYAGPGSSFVAGEYNGVVINDSDPAAGSTFVNLINPGNLGTDINGYYVNVGAFDGVQTQLTMDFTTHIESVAFNFANPQGFLTVTSFDGSGVAMAPVNYFGVGAFINQAGSTVTAGSVSINGIGNISKLVIEPNFNEALILDNLEFSPIPVPAALPLLASGLICLSLVGRRKRS